MMRGSMAQAPMSQPASPTRVNRNAHLAPGVASRRSEAIAMIAPAPTQMPSTAAMTGRPQCSIALTRSPVMRVKASRPFMSMPTSGPMMSCTSPPEQKLPPFGASTTTSTSVA
jgi:hypothetical protein